MAKRRLLVLLLALALGSGVMVGSRPATVAGAATPNITVWPASLYYPSAIALGPDGAFWFTNKNDTTGASIGRSTIDGTMSRYPDLMINDARDITTGSDGALWFVNGGDDGVPGPGSIGRVTTAGAFTRFTDPEIQFPISIASGSDGALWFVDANTGKIGRITTAGSVSAYAAGVGISSSITAGSDGALWFTTPASVGRIATDGTITSLPVAGFAPSGNITEGPDGSLWFPVGNGIDRMTTGGTLTNFPVNLYGISSIVGGPDGALWFTGYLAYGRITTAGVVTVVPLGNRRTSDLVVGSDNQIWLAGTDLLLRVDAVGVTMTLVPEVSNPAGLASGPFGEMFVTGRGGAITELSPAVGTYHPLNLVAPQGGVTGSDLSYWFGNGGHELAKLDRGHVKVLTNPNIAAPTELITGPDRRIWFANSNRSIGRLNGDGSVTRFGISAIPNGLAAGADGSVWFTTTHTIGRISPAGQVSERTDLANGTPGPMARGLDGVVWFTDVDALGRIGTDGTLSHLAVAHVSNQDHVSVGPDGAIWFTSQYDNVIGRVSPSGVVTRYPVPIGGPRYIAAGADGGVWFAGPAAVGRMDSPRPVIRPTVSVGDVSVVEGDQWTRQGAVNVTMSAVSPTPVVAFVALRGPGDPNVTLTQGSVLLLPGETSRAATLNVNGDTARRRDRVLPIDLLGVMGSANPARAVGQATVIEDDQVLAGLEVSIGDASAVEGTRDFRTLQVPVTLSSTSSAPVLLQWTVFADPSVAFVTTPLSGVLVIPAGATARSVTLSIRSKVGIAPDRQLYIVIHDAAGAAIGRSVGVATMIDGG